MPEQIGKGQTSWPMPQVPAAIAAGYALTSTTIPANANTVETPRDLPDEVAVLDDGIPRITA